MSEKKEFVKLWLSYRTYFEAYSAAEVGRLVLAMIEYKSSGAEPEFSGSERFIWPAIKRDIDEASAVQAALAGASRENGKKGGRPKKENPEKPAGFSETQEKPWTKDKGQGQGQGQGRYTAPARAKAPTLEQVQEAARLRGCPELAKDFFDYYDAAGWRDAEGKPVYNWRQKLVVWQMREEKRGKPREERKPSVSDPNDWKEWSV